MINILESCLRAVKPQAIGYGLLIEEVVKVVLAYILIIGFNQLFLGAILSIIVPQPSNHYTIYDLFQDTCMKK